MTTKYPNLVQAALLYDRVRPVDLEKLVQLFLSAGERVGLQYNRVETKPGAFYRLFGQDTMITVEYLGQPAQARLFDAALSTTFTQVANPNARELIARHRSHILINVHHGAMPPTGEIAALLAQLNVSEMLQAGQTLDHYRERLSLCGTLAHMAHHLSPASLVHWTTSDHLLKGDTFAKLTDGHVPGLLHIHPFLSNGGKSADGRDQVAITTFGATPFSGREIHLVANPLPWQEGLGLILVFLKIATMKQGYVIPDNDVFTDEDKTVSCSVRHIPDGAKSGEFNGPLYRLEILRSEKHSFMSPAHTAPERTFDDRTVPAALSTMAAARLSTTRPRCSASQGGSPCRLGTPASPTIQVSASCETRAQAKARLRPRASTRPLRRHDARHHARRRHPRRDRLPQQQRRPAQRQHRLR